MPSSSAGEISGVSRVLGRAARLDSSAEAVIWCSELGWRWEQQARLVFLQCIFCWHQGLCRVWGLGRDLQSNMHVDTSPGLQEWE